MVMRVAPICVTVGCARRLLSIGTATAMPNTDSSTAARKARRAAARADPRTGRSDNRLVDYGYNEYAQMFNARQRLHLALLGAAIGNVKGGARDGLAVAFSDHLTTNNCFAPMLGWRRLTPLFSIRAYRHIARPVEINPGSIRTAAALFPTPYGPWFGPLTP